MPKNRIHVVTSFSLEASYGREMTLGAARFRRKRTDWLLKHTAISFLNKVGLSEPNGAIGHYFSEQHLKLLTDQNVPYLVSVSSRADPEAWLRIIPDNRAIGRVAAEYFMGKGYQHYCGLKMDIPFANERIEGFTDCLRAHGITSVMVCDSATIKDRLPHGISLPLALFSPSDRAAASFMNQLVEMDLRVPEDIAILGVDNDEIASTFAPVPLSSIKLPYEEIGFAACEALETMIENGEQVFGTHQFDPGGVVERRSTEARAVLDTRVRKAQAYIRENLRVVGGVEDLTTALKLNRRTLDRLFEDNLGMSVARWMMERRAEYAERMLLETDYTVDYVAELAGFGDRRRLYRAFNKLRSPLPRELRRG